MKRVFDIVCSLGVVLLISPLLLLVAVLVKLESKGPVFYLQQRLGKNGNVFNLLKFRSMTNVSRKLDEQVLKGSAGVTRVGAIIRRFKIDELPQLINVLRGEMSFVGPRPCLPELRQSFNADGESRLRVVPGLTGLAQVSGNIHLTWEQRWALDREYVENQSLWLDMKILARTLPIIFFGESWGLK